MLGKLLIAEVILCFVKISFCDDDTNDQVVDLRVLDRILKNYDRRDIPLPSSEEAMTVKYEIFIRSFGFTDPSSMDFEVDLYLRQTWRDPRLHLDNITTHLDMDDLRFLHRIWKPEIYFPNANEAKLEKVTVPNMLVRLKPLGDILYMLRIKLLFTCMMELSTYPLDSQVCTMEFASVRTLLELEMKWKNDEPVLIHRGLRMPQFKITNIVATDCQLTYAIGNFSCLLVELHMSRSIGFHLVQTYLPTVLFVFISWLSFWMDVDALVARTSLGITTLFTVSSKSSALQGGVPQVSYVKAIDVWMGVCTAFVFCSLLELTVVNCLWRKQKLKIIFEKRSQIRSSTTISLITTASAVKSTEDSGGGDSQKDVSVGAVCVEATSSSSGEVTTKPKRKKAERCLAREIDSWCQILFPLAFICFVAGYWWYYVN